MIEKPKIGENVHVVLSYDDSLPVEYDGIICGVYRGKGYTSVCIDHDGKMYWEFSTNVYRPSDKPKEVGVNL